MLKIPSYLTGFSSRSDGSAGIRFTTQELTTEDFVAIKENLNRFGWLVFQENVINLEDLPTEFAEDKQKTPSKRLRAVLFILWKQEGEKGDFETYYRVKMEKLIEYIKNKLD